MKPLAISEVNQKENDLVRRVQGGDEKAFEELMKVYKPYITNLCFQMMPYRYIIEDTISLVMIKIWQNISSFEGKSCLKTWMHSLTFNVIQDRRRLEATWCKRHLPEEGVDALLFVPSREAMPDVITNNKDTNGLLLWAMSYLNEDQKVVFTLFEIEELSHDQIATRLNCSSGTVRSRLFYAKKIMQGLLESRDCTSN